MTRGSASIIGLVLAAVLFVAANVWTGAALYASRIDLTRDRLFTLSEGSLRVLDSLDEPVRLKFYFSEKLANALPSMQTYGRRVRDLIETYAAIADGRIEVQVIDPEPFTEAEDDAVRAGLQPIPLSSAENLYFGLVGTNTTDDQQVVAYFPQEREPFLEYDLTRLVYNLSEPKKQVVGLITSHQMNAGISPLLRAGGRGPEPWAIVEQLESSFALKPIDWRSEDLPGDIDLLLIVHPGEMPPKLLYQIDQYVLRGGRAMVFVDPLSEVAVSASRSRMPGAGGPPPADTSNLEPLFKAWGIALAKDRFVGDWPAARQVNAGTAQTPRIVRYLSWLELTPQNFDLNDVVLGDLGPLALASAGSIERLEGARATLSPLVTSSAQSMLMDIEQVRWAPNPQALIEGFKPDDKRHVIAARIGGQVPSAFPDGPPKPEQPAAGKDDDDKSDDADKPDGAAKSDDDEAKPAAAATPAAEHLNVSAAPLNVIVVADSDMLFDQFWVQTQDFFGQRLQIPISANADFLINALDNLTGSDDLISLRSRGKSERPFEVVEALRRDAERRFLDEEKALTDKLTKAQNRITELQGKAKAGGGALLSREQQAEIDKARLEIAKTRRELRDVQAKLNRDIETLQTQLKFANIGLVPIVVSLIALVLAAVRYQRRRRRIEGARA